MGWPGPRRPQVTARLSESGIAYIDDLARERGLIRGNGEPNRSEMMRVMLAYAATHMPRDWTTPH